MGAKRGPGRPFAPGNPGGPGRPPTPPEEKLAKRLNKGEFERLANRFLWLSEADLAKELANPNLSALERLIANILAHGINDGDQARAEWFLNRLLGKVTDKVEVSQPKPFVIARASGEQVVLGAALPKDEGGDE